MKSCLILTSHLEGSDFLKTLDLSEYDGIFCADGGLQWLSHLPEKGDLPVYLIGDYDSGPRPTEAQKAAAEDLILLPTVKDMTDSEAAVDLAVREGFSRIHVLGGLGGRLDHTLGNLGLLQKYAEDKRVAELFFEDGQNRVFLKTPGTFRLPAPGTALPEGGPVNRFHYFGLIPWGGPVEGLTISGAKYVLTSFTLSPDTTLGVSNEVLGTEDGNPAGSAEISHNHGFLLVILSSDKAR
ncbi:MAG: thiamine diphosphokinase [Clostridia bacterium]|nr:thiamine diphosphokinase [Clostridia bacterium]